MTIPLILFIDFILIFFCIGVGSGILLLEFICGIDLTNLKIKEGKRVYIIYIRIFLILFFGLQIVMNVFGLLY